MCDQCGTPLEFSDDLIVVIKEYEDETVLVPIDIIICPECNHQISLIHVYKSLEVTEEFKSVKRE